MPRPIPDRPAAGRSAVLRQVPGRPCAVAELVHVLLIAAAVIVVVGAAGPVGLLTWRWRRTRLGAARAMPPLPPRVARAAQPLPAPRPAIERTPDIHLHLHGVSAEDVAAIIGEQQSAARPAIEED
jgi:hypothetical protein